MAGGFWFLLLIIMIALVAGWEYGRMMKRAGYRTTPFLTLGLIALLLLNGFRSDLSLDCILGLTLLGSLIWQLYRRDSTAPTVDWALTIAGGLYIGLGMAHMVLIRQLANGQAWIWLVFVSTWGADSAAYLAGYTLGRHKLWPRHSPKKSWEGLFGGIGGGLLGAAAIAAFSNLGLINLLLIGAIIPIAGLYGDISISMMKRHVGVKDSSNLLPGHGGVLDRIDSLLFVSVVVYYYAIWHHLFIGLDFGIWLTGLGF